MARPGFAAPAPIHHQPSGLLSRPLPGRVHPSRLCHLSQGQGGAPGSSAHGGSLSLTSNLTTSPYSLPPPIAPAPQAMPWQILPRPALPEYAGLASPTVLLLRTASSPCAGPQRIKWHRRGHNIHQAPRPGPPRREGAVRYSLPSSAFQPQLAEGLVSWDLLAGGRLY